MHSNYIEGDKRIRFLISSGHVRIMALMRESLNALHSMKILFGFLIVLRFW
jgi:hypothetical protein